MRLATKEWTRAFLASVGRDRRMERSCLSWKKQLFTTLFTWSSIVSLLSMMTPRSRTESRGEISAPWITRLSLEILANRWREPRQMNWVLSPFNSSEIFAERSRDSGRRSRDRRPTVKQRFFWTFQAIWKILKKSLNGHATVVGGHATIGRLSNNVFSTFQAIRKQFEKSRWTVTRQWSEVTRPSADCQTTFFGRFKQFGKILKKVAERSRDSGRKSRDHRPTVKQRFFDVSSN